MRQSRFFILSMLLFVYATIIVSAAESPRVSCYESPSYRYTNKFCYERDVLGGNIQPIQDVLNVRHPPSGEKTYTYADLQQYSLDAATSAQAYYQEAVSYARIAQLKRTSEEIQRLELKPVAQLPDGFLAVVYKNEPQEDHIDVVFIDQARAAHTYTLMYQGKEITNGFVRVGERVTASIPVSEVTTALKAELEQVGKRYVQYSSLYNDTVWFLLPLIEMKVQDTSATTKAVVGVYPVREVSFVSNPNELERIQGVADPVQSFRLTYRKDYSEKAVVAAVEPGPLQVAKDFSMEVFTKADKPISQRIKLAGKSFPLNLPAPTFDPRELAQYEQDLSTIYVKITDAAGKAIARYFPDTIRFDLFRNEVKDREQIALECLSCTGATSDNEETCLQEECDTLGSRSCTWAPAKPSASLGNKFKAWGGGILAAITPKFIIEKDAQQEYYALRTGYCIAKTPPRYGNCALCQEMDGCNPISPELCTNLGNNCVMTDGECVDSSLVVFGEDVNRLLDENCNIPAETEALVSDVVRDPANIKRIENNIRENRYDEFIKQVKDKDDNTIDRRTQAILAGMIATETGARKKTKEEPNKFGCSGLLQFCGPTAAAKKIGLCDSTSKLPPDQWGSINKLEWKKNFCIKTDLRQNDQLVLQRGYELLQDNMDVISKSCNKYIDRGVNTALLTYAIAAHNTGAGNVCSAIKKAGSKDPKWVEVSNRLPEVTGKDAKETQCYVTKVLFYAAQYGHLFGVEGRELSPSEVYLAKEIGPQGTLESHEFLYEYHLTNVAPFPSNVYTIRISLRYNQKEGGWQWRSSRDGKWLPISAMNGEVSVSDPGVSVYSVSAKDIDILSQLKGAASYEQGISRLIAHAQLSESKSGNLNSKRFPHLVIVRSDIELYSFEGTAITIDGMQKDVVDGKRKTILELGRNVFSREEDVEAKVRAEEQAEVVASKKIKIRDTSAQTFDDSLIIQFENNMWNLISPLSAQEWHAQLVESLQQKDYDAGIAVIAQFALKNQKRVVTIEGTTKDVFNIAANVKDVSVFNRQAVGGVAAKKLLLSLDEFNEQIIDLKDYVNNHQKFSSLLTAQQLGQNGVESFLRSDIAVVPPTKRDYLSDYVFVNIIDERTVRLVRLTWSGNSEGQASYLVKSQDAEGFLLEFGVDQIVPFETMNYRIRIVKVDDKIAFSAERVS